MKKKEGRKQMEYTLIHMSRCVRLVCFYAFKIKNDVLISSILQKPSC